MEILYQGHGSFRITSKCGKTIYVDPYAGNGYELPADAILVTHQHYDHNATDKPVKKPNCIIWSSKDALKNGVYLSADIAGAEVRAVEAYNQNHKKEECVGYLVKLDGHLVYFAGDTSETKQMQELKKENIEYAFLPCDGRFNMNVSEAVRCAEIIGAQHAVPVHVAPGKLYDAVKAKTFNARNAFYMKPEDTLTL